MKKNTRKIKSLLINEDTLIIRFTGVSKSCTARILDRTLDASGCDIGYILDRLIHREGETFELENSRHGRNRFALSGCYVTQMLLTD